MQETYVRVADDGSRAWLYLVPKMNSESYTKQELIEILRKNGIVAGLNSSNLAAMAKKKVYEREICVANRVEPILGKDGYYEYAFEEHYRRVPQIREDGSVDYTGFGLFQQVRKGTVLARYHRAEPGKNGQDIWGNVVKVPPVKDLAPLRGQGVVASRTEKDVYEAGCDGKVDFENGVLKVLDVLVMSQDIDRNDGVVEFEGDLVIMGNVEAGSVVRAGRTLTVNGTVEGAKLTAGGDIVLRRGITGGYKAKIRSRGNVFADFIEQAELETRGNVEANSIINSMISADGKVILTGKQGILYGGYTHAGQGITCKQLGNDAEIKTQVHAGCLSETMDQYATKRKDIVALQKKYKVLAQQSAEMAELVKMAEGNVDDSMTEMIRDQLEMIAQIKQKIEKEQEAFARLQRLTKQSKNAVIRVEGKIFMGVTIAINDVKMQVDKNNSYMEYRNISGMLASNVIAV
ncbi:MAG: DUF342 domain-containing protein [Lachnospiraceae bacterium]|jgi:hypothetical protein|nr:DUF342 domain-containing protein [Lachnospiraceae bacterium]